MTGIVKVTHTPGRQQPFTVWLDGEVVGFCETERQVQATIRREQTRSAFYAARERENGPQA